MERHKEPINNSSSECEVKKLNRSAVARGSQETDGCQEQLNSRHMSGGQVFMGKGGEKREQRRKAGNAIQRVTSENGGWGTGIFPQNITVSGWGKMGNAKKLPFFVFFADHGKKLSELHYLKLLAAKTNPSAEGEPGIE